MKSLLVCFVAMLVTFAAFSQKAKNNSDTTLNTYLTYNCPMHPEYVSNVSAKCPKCNSDMTLSKKEQMKREVGKLYTCPMHPQVMSTKAGKCPDCNMDLTKYKPTDKVNKN